MRTAFPWVPATTWQQETRTDGATVWHVTVTDPSPEPEGMRSVSAHGSTPGAALAALLEVVAWWLDYDGRRGCTAGERYVGRRP